LNKMKRKVIYGAFLLVFAVSIATTTSSCKAKEGCGLEEKYGAQTNKDGSLSTKRGKSNLFSKKQRKKMKKRGN